jgi:UTP:GlnB (protein PII) uridylyltransferase
MPSMTINGICVTYLLFIENELWNDWERNLAKLLYEACDDWFSNLGSSNHRVRSEVRM